MIAGGHAAIQMHFTGRTRNSLNTEGQHATHLIPNSPPPRTLKASQRILLPHLWEALPQSDRDRTILTLSVSVR